MMLNWTHPSNNRRHIAAVNDEVRLSQTTTLLLCASGVVAVWYALRCLGRRPTSCASVSDDRVALRDSTSDRRSAARWENEGGAMLTGYPDDLQHLE